MLTRADILKDQHVPIEVLDCKSSMTQHVCRSTLAAEAAHLANAVEIVYWTAVILADK